MSRKTFCNLCGAEIKGHSAKVVAVSAEMGERGFAPYMDACRERNEKRGRFDG